MQDSQNHFFFGCARLQPKPITSPATILPNRVSGYTIHAFGEKLADFNSKMQWRQASFYFKGITEPLNIYAPLLRIGYTDPCPAVCTPVLTSNGELHFERKDNPYFSASDWERGINALFEVIRLHHHLDGANGNGKLLKSTSYTRDLGINADWYKVPGITQRHEIRQAIIEHLSQHPDVFDRCFALLKEFGINPDAEKISPDRFHATLAQPTNGSRDTVQWADRWSQLKAWWCDWEEHFLFKDMPWPCNDAKKEILDQTECGFQDSFYGQLLVEETIPMILRGLLWRMASSSTLVTHYSYGSGSDSRAL